MTQRPQADPYTVEGRGEFPVDMLRKEFARPFSEEDRIKIEATIADGLKPREIRRVTLVTRERETLDGRWESFGWRVVRPLRPWYPHSGYVGPQADRDLPAPASECELTMRVRCPDRRTAMAVERAMREAAATIAGVEVEPSGIGQAGHDSRH
jgi:hypothetical protein